MLVRLGETGADSKLEIHQPILFLQEAEAREHRQAVLAAAKEQQAQDSTFHQEMEALESWADDFYGE
jgi:hypothetical protein